MSFFHVYILQSDSNPDRFYTGFTQDLRSRLRKHNDGAVPHMAKYRPWHVKTALAFDVEARARDFERYLKSGSGRAFAKRHL